MISGNYFIVLICVLLPSNVIGDELDCTETEVCKCYNRDRADPSKPTQVRCEDVTDTTKLNFEKLQAFGKKVKGDWDVLYIHNTKLDKIDANTFPLAKFKKIFIENNDVLAKIDATSFVPSTITESLDIRGNKNLIGSDIFEVAKKLGAGLKSIWFDKNKITIPASAFVGTNDIFKSLQVINIDNQQDNILTIPSPFISNLPKLEQVSLGSNKITTIKDEAFDLTNSSPVSTHVSIYLDKNPDIDQTKISEAIIKSPSNTAISIGLVLETTGIKEITTGFVGLLTKIATNPKGRVYIKGITLTTCDCTNQFVKSIRAEKFKNIIHGMETIDCGAGKKLSDCPA